MAEYAEASRALSGKVFSYSELYFSHLQQRFPANSPRSGDRHVCLMRHFGLMIPQSQTERLLEERLATLDVTIERQVEVTSLESRAKGIDAVLQYPDGRKKEYRRIG